MLYITRYLLIFNRSCKCFDIRSNALGKAFYCDQKKIIFEALEKTSKDKAATQAEATSKAKAGEEIETVTFGNEEEIMQTIITEKEKDANVRSRLSKECNKLLDKRVALGTSGLNLHLEPNSTKNTSWEDYMFDKTIDNLKQDSEMEAKRPCDGFLKIKKPVVSTPDGDTSKSKKPAGDGGDPTPPPPTTPITRIVRGEPGKVILAFIPEEWFKFFIPRTGVCGFGTLLFTFCTFLVSKEYYVLEHNYYNGLGMVIVIWAAIKYAGPSLSKYLDKEIDDYEKGWQQGRDNMKEILEEQIEDEKRMQYQADGQLLLIEAKRENVHLQLEEEFRLRQMMVYREVLNRLNYQVAVAKVHEKIFHRNLVDYVTREVKKSITPELEDLMLNVSIDNLLLELEKGDSGKR